MLALDTELLGLEPIRCSCGAHVEALFEVSRQSWTGEEGSWSVSYTSSACNPVEFVNMWQGKMLH
jgi:hypothetical protein